jgi:hypothetical protein
MGEYLIWSEKHGAWWRPYARGYTMRIVEAGRYTKERADAEVANSNSFGGLGSVAIPVPDGLPDRVSVDV